MGRKRAFVGALVLALLAAVLTVSGIQLAGGETERLTNGGFESGFYAAPVGAVGNGWHWFDNGGQAEYGFYEETWAPVIYKGQHSQLIEINTLGRSGSDPDRYSGIFQTVAVVPGQTYELSLHGMLRAMEDDPDRSGYNYRVQYGVDYTGGTDWQAVDNWVELPWDTVYPRLTPGMMDSYTTSVTATGNRLTLFIRVWKKWATAGRELDVNLDSISLKGALPAETGGPSISLSVPSFAAAGRKYTVVVKAKNDVGIVKLELYDGNTLVGKVEYDVGLLELSSDFLWRPATAGSHTLKAIAYDVGGSKASKTVTVEVGELGQFLTNGGFESGFKPIPLGMVGKGWGWFSNGGLAQYGFYDDTWEPVIFGGDHSQLIEINTLGQAASDPDRYAGIYQVVDGLTVGATYRLSMHGMLRVLNEDDLQGYPYRVQWGFDPAGGSDWRVVNNWVEVPWDKIFPRLAPEGLSDYSAAFEAPSTKVTLFIRVWKKWGTTNREVDVNLDGISLKGYK
jgi:hypothetical protein